MLGVNKELRGPESHVEPRGHYLVETQKVEQIFKFSLGSLQRGKDIVFARGDQREVGGKRSSYELRRDDGSQLLQVILSLTGVVVEDMMGSN